jgi:tetratricopeptide (TPR) repeat protein/tRNA A-37 threonylcarbamoyl transferase component Bud32
VARERSSLTSVWSEIGQVGHISTDISVDDTVAFEEVLSVDSTFADDASPICATRADSGRKVVVERPAETSGGVDLDMLPTVDPALYTRGAELARGGMGRILQVRDHKLGRDLAIKELLFSSPGLEARFEREMKITARLQHPSIIAVHDAGRWPSGEPFYTMKHVEGETLDRVIDQTSELPERLALVPTVLAVADALAYAHAQGVIHRDLKPSNILVGAFGETVVIDWGLAKQLRDATPDEALDASHVGPTDEGLSLLGEALGTPAYMPPEQAAGQSLDARADVYAIGAILYHVLSGGKPYSDTQPENALELILTVAKSGPTHLGELQDDISPDLLTIVEKAMSRDASARYPTARELAADLRRYQTGQLVGAHQYSTWELVKRWVGRNRATVAVAAVMAVVLAVGAAVSFGRIASERDRAEAERVRANEQKILAEKNRVEVEGLLDFMLVDLRNQLEPLGKLALLDAVATKAVDYYQARTGTGSEDDLHRRSLAFRNIGNVLLAQGRLPEALVQFRAALAINETLAAQSPDHATWQRDLALGNDDVGDVYLAQGNFSEALAAYRTGLAIRAKLTAWDPSNIDWQRELSVSHDKVGEVLFAQGHSSEALVAFRTSQAINKKLAARDPSNARRQRNLALSHVKVGDALLAHGNSSGALVAYRASQAINEKLVARDPSNAQWQRALSVSHEKVGNVLLAQGGSSPALVSYRASLAISEKLAAQDPSNANWQRDLSVSYLKVGETLRAQGKSSRALVAFRAAMAISEKLTAQDPSNATWQNDVAVSHVYLGGILLKEGEQKQAREHLARAAAIYERSASVGLDFYNAGCVYALGGNPDKAFEMLDKAIALGERDHAWAQKDSDLASLRNDPRWKPLIEKMKNKR